MEWNWIILCSPPYQPPSPPLPPASLWFYEKSSTTIQGIATWNYQEKIKSAIPREKNYAAWLVKNRQAVFSKPTQKIPLSVTGKQASKHFPFSHFYILSSCVGCYFSGISCAFHFGQMFNGFLKVTSATKR